MATRGLKSVLGARLQYLSGSMSKVEYFWPWKFGSELIDLLLRIAGLISDQPAV